MGLSQSCIDCNDCVTYEHHMVAGRHWLKFSTGTQVTVDRFRTEWDVEHMEKRLVFDGSCEIVQGGCTYSGQMSKSRYTGHWIYTNSSVVCQIVCTGRFDPRRLVYAESYGTVWHTLPNGQTVAGYIDQDGTFHQFKASDLTFPSAPLGSLFH